MKALALRANPRYFAIAVIAVAAACEHSPPAADSVARFERVGASKNVSVAITDDGCVVSLIPDRVSIDAPPIVSTAIKRTARIRVVGGPASFYLRAQGFYIGEGSARASIWMGWRKFQLFSSLPGVPSDWEFLEEELQMTSARRITLKVYFRPDQEVSKPGTQFAVDTVDLVIPQCTEAAKAAKDKAAANVPDTSS